MKYWKDGELHDRRRHINEDGRNTLIKSPKLVPGAGFLPA